MRNLIVVIAALSVATAAHAQVMYSPAPGGGIMSYGGHSTGVYAMPGYGGYGTNFVVPQQPVINTNPYGSTGVSHLPLVTVDPNMGRR